MFLQNGEKIVVEVSNQNRVWISGQKVEVDKARKIVTAINKIINEKSKGK